MIENLDGFRGVYFAITVQVTYHLLLFGINADNRIARCRVGFSQFRDAFKLSITVLVASPRFLFQCLAFDIAVFLIAS